MLLKEGKLEPNSVTQFDWTTVSKFVWLGVVDSMKKHILKNQILCTSR